MSTNPFVSIIIASFNSSKELSRAIDSVINQDISDLELVIIDGGSSDGTQQLIRSYGNHISSWVSEPDRGIYDAWNKGLKLSRGEWVSFLGADDLFCVDALKTYQRYILESQNIEFISSRIVQSFSGGFMRTIGQPWSWDCFRRYMNIAHVGSFHHRKLFEEFGFFDPSLKVCGDYEFLLRAGKNLHTGFINKPLVMMSAGGISDSSILVIFETFKVKRRFNTVAPRIALYDFLIALLKWYPRKAYRIFHKVLFKLKNKYLSSRH